MNYKIVDIQGIGPEFTEKLKAHNVHTTDDLLKFAETPQGFKRLADMTGISEKLVEKWSRMAGLMRVNGIGPQYAELLHFSGVDTVEKLVAQPVDGLLRKLAEVNSTRSLTNTLPDAGEVQKWVEQIKTMPKLETARVR